MTMTSTATTTAEEDVAADTGAAGESRPPNWPEWNMAVGPLRLLDDEWPSASRWQWVERLHGATDVVPNDVKMMAAELEVPGMALYWVAQSPRLGDLQEITRGRDGERLPGRTAVIGQRSVGFNQDRGDKGPVVAVWRPAWEGWLGLIACKCVPGGKIWGSGHVSGMLRSLELHRVEELDAETHGGDVFGTWEATRDAASRRLPRLESGLLVRLAEEANFAFDEVWRAVVCAGYGVVLSAEEAAEWRQFKGMMRKYWMRLAAFRVMRRIAKDAGPLPKVSPWGGEDTGDLLTHSSYREVVVLPTERAWEQWVRLAAGDQERRVSVAAIPQVMVGAGRAYSRAHEMVPAPCNGRLDHRCQGGGFHLKQAAEGMSQMEWALVTALYTVANWDLMSDCAWALNLGDEDWGPEYTRGLEGSLGLAADANDQLLEEFRDALITGETHRDTVQMMAREAWMAKARKMIVDLLGDEDGRWWTLSSKQVPQEHPYPTVTEYNLGRRQT